MDRGRVVLNSLALGSYTHGGRVRLGHSWAQDRWPALMAISPALPSRVAGQRLCRSERSSKRLLVKCVEGRLIFFNFFGAKWTGAELS